MLSHRILVERALLPLNISSQVVNSTTCGIATFRCGCSSGQPPRGSEAANGIQLLFRPAVAAAGTSAAAVAVAAAVVVDACASAVAAADDAAENSHSGV